MNKAFEGYLFKKKIDLTQYCNGDERFVTLREPTTPEVLVILKDANGEDSDMKMMGNIIPLLPALIFEHNFFDGDKKIPNKDVAEFVQSKVDMMMDVTIQYVSALPFANGNVKK